MGWLLVYTTLAVFNFMSSIIQGVAGIGDAIILQVLWYFACAASDEFKNTPLGPEPVRAVALLMYIRLLFMSPLVVYLGYNDSIFSKQMVLMMAIPSTILSLIGVLLYKMMDTQSLKIILGWSSLFFAGVYGLILINRYMQKRKKIQKLKDKNIKLTVEADAISEEARLSRNASFQDLRASFAGSGPLTNHSLIFHNTPLASARAASGPASSSGPATFQSGNQFDADPIAAQTLDPETGILAGTTEAYLSTVGNEVFTANEAAMPQMTEENVPPLELARLSPLATITYTRVRINRNIDANGKIKMSTKIGASVAASIAGLMASLTGVNAPPQIIFILLYDAPNYIVRVNFSAQTIPGGLVRFLLGMYNGIFTSGMIPMFLTTIIFGGAGVYVGNLVGRLLGPISFNVFVLFLLLLSAFVMITNQIMFLAFLTLLTAVATIGCGYWEIKKNKAIVEKQRETEMEIEKRMDDVMEELQRSMASMPASLRAQWGGVNIDNDDVEDDGLRSQPHSPNATSAATHTVVSMAGASGNDERAHAVSPTSMGNLGSNSDLRGDGNHGGDVLRPIPVHANGAVSPSPSGTSGAMGYHKAKDVVIVDHESGFSDDDEAPDVDATRIRNADSFRGQTETETREESKKAAAVDVTAHEDAAVSSSVGSVHTASAEEGDDLR